MKAKAPSPGSDAAIDQGCTCPILDNGHGKGSLWGPNTFIMHETCPMHRGAIRRAKSNGQKSIDNTDET